MSLSRSRYLAVVALVTVGGACASSASPGVRVDALQADIVFGVDAPEQAAITPINAPDFTTDGSGPETVNPSLNIPFHNRIPDRFKNVGEMIPGSAVSGSCPTAPSGAAPRTNAGRNASAPPLAGLYRYRISGTRTVTLGGTKVTTPVAGFEPRKVQAVQSTGKTKWSFEMVEPLGRGGSRVVTWSVNTDPQEVKDPQTADTNGDGVPDGRGVKPPYVGQNPVRAGEPGRGIALESIADHDANGNTIGSFNAIPSLLFMPLPVLPGEQFQSAAMDRQGQSMQIQGQVDKTQTVDACGELADGWKVSMSVVTAQAQDTVTTTEEWIFSTPMGGLPISHRIQGSATNPNTGATETYDITYSLGQIDPTPDRVAAS